MKPARQTMSVRAALRWSSIFASNSARSLISLELTMAVAMPASAALARPAASERLESTSTISAG